MDLNLLLAALSPAVIIIYIFFQHDHQYNKEPYSLLVKCFFAGVLSVFVSLLLSTPLDMLGFDKGVEGAFYDAFLNVEKTGKRIYVGVDCSGSMTSHIDTTNITSMQVAACMAMQFLKLEDQPVVKGFGNSMIDLNLKVNDDLNLVMRKMEEIDWHMTDCAQPMLDAIKNKLMIDCFVIITDSETYFGKIHPFEALKQYRKWSGINAKMIVMATSTSGFSIADPSDSGMLDVVGFSSDVFQVINYFLKD